jgi:hypothetical protein
VERIHVTGKRRVHLASSSSLLVPSAHDAAFTGAAWSTSDMGHWEEPPAVARAGAAAVVPAGSGAGRRAVVPAPEADGQQEWNDVLDAGKVRWLRCACLCACAYVFVCVSMPASVYTCWSVSLTRWCGLLDMGNR